jgi:phage FluMu gp28-like protein
MTKAARKIKQGMAAVAAIAAATGMTPRIDHVDKPLQNYRGYQQPVIRDHTTKTAILHWSRQIGKSTTLAGWAVDRLLKQLKTHDSWLVTVLSNSRANGGEFVLKIHEVCRKLGQAFVEEGNREELDGSKGMSEDAKLDMMRFEVRLEIGGKLGRIIVLAANPRTARGFSGDLILDEFAFHQDSRAIWEAAEPIISANPEFLCRIASTGNGRRNMFYQLIAEGRIPYYRVRRSDAWKRGELKIYSVITGKELTPDQARNEASDKRAYDQNYECEFNDEALALLTQELISQAEREGVAIDDQEWSNISLKRIRACKGLLYGGQDVGRNRDLSVITVLEKIGSTLRVVGMLRLQGMRGPAQLAQLNLVLELPNFRRVEIDMTGLGVFLVDWAQEKHGMVRVAGVNFATTEPITKRIRADGRKRETARVTEIMATELLGVFEDKRIEIPADHELRDDLRKPEKLVSPNGRVSIAAERDEAGHADHFWSLALAVRASTRQGAAPFKPKPFERRGRGMMRGGESRVAAARDRSVQAHQDNVVPFTQYPLEAAA